MRELDVEVARLLGWTVQRWPNVVRFDLVKPDGTRIPGYDTEVAAWRDVPHFSTEIAAALMVVEHLHANGWVLSLTMNHQAQPWYCRFVRKVTQQGRAYACSAPEAICRAALAAVAVE